MLLAALNVPNQLPEWLIESADVVMKGEMSHIWKQKIVLPKWLREFFPYSDEEDLDMLCGKNLHC